MILVTGANGFIGRYLVDRLVADGVEVIATGTSTSVDDYYGQRGIRYEHVDIRQAEDFDRLPPANAVVHLAGKLSIDAENWSPEDYFLTNALGTYNVLEYCRKSEAEVMVYSMTHSDMNKSPTVLIKADTPQNYGGVREMGSPIPYIISKIAGMNAIQAYANDGLIRPAVFRLPGIRGFGSRDTFHNCVFHQFIQKAIKGQPIEIWGEHATRRDFVYVKDVVNAIVMALENEGADGTYNIGTGHGLTILEEAEAIIEAFSDPDNRSELVFRPDIEEVRKRSYSFDYTKAFEDFGWKPQFSYQDGLVDFKREMELDRFKILREAEMRG